MSKHRPHKTTTTSTEPAPTTTEPAPTTTPTTVPPTTQAPTTTTEPAPTTVPPTTEAPTTTAATTTVPFSDESDPDPAERDEPIEVEDNTEPCLAHDPHEPHLPDGTYRIVEGATYGSTQWTLLACEPIYTEEPTTTVDPLTVAIPGCVGCEEPVTTTAAPGNTLPSTGSTPETPYIAGGGLLAFVVGVACVWVSVRRVEA